MTTQPEPPQDRIDALIARLAAASPVDDRVALAGELGLAWLELYEQDGDEDALRAGADCLRRTVAAAPDHPDRARWALGLGLGYAERGRRRRSLPDHHEAITVLSTLYVDTQPDAPMRARAVAALGELCWARYWLVRHDLDADVVRCLAEVEALLERITPLLTAPPDPAELGDARLVAGFAFLEWYELTGEPTYLDHGIDLLAAASIWDLAANDPRRCQGGSELAESLRQLSILDNCADALDRAIAVAVRTIDLSSPADGTAWFLVHRYAASAAYSRWRARGCRADLDLAYRCWQPLLELGMDPASAQEYQALLADRAQY